MIVAVIYPMTSHNSAEQERTERRDTSTPSNKSIGSPERVVKSCLVVGEWRVPSPSEAFLVGMDHYYSQPAIEPTAYRIHVEWILGVPTVLETLQTARIL